MKKTICTALTALMFAAPVFAAGQVDVVHPYSRITAPTVKMGAAFMEITNNSGKDDVLVGGSTPVSKKIEIHQTVIDDQGVMKMREAKDGIKLPAGQTVTLQPGGLHIMLIDLKKPLKLGDTYPLTLQFKHAKKQTVTVDVNNGKVTDMSEMPMDHSHH